MDTFVGREDETSSENRGKVTEKWKETERERERDK